MSRVVDVYGTVIPHVGFDPAASLHVFNRTRADGSVVVKLSYCPNFGSDRTRFGRHGFTAYDSRRSHRTMGRRDLKFPLPRRGPDVDRVRTSTAERRVRLRYAALLLGEFRTPRALRRRPGWLRDVKGLSRSAGLIWSPQWANGGRTRAANAGGRHA